MAIESPAGDYEPDTTNHARISIVGSYGDSRDELYVPGDGIYFSKNAVHDMERQMHDRAKEHKEIHHCYRQFLSEEAIEEYYHIIQAQKAMTKAAEDSREKQRKEYEASCYDGTDTINPLAQKKAIPNRKQNEFSIDRSKSTISLSIVAGSSWLNGSAVKHNHTVHISITSPDGREICDVMMTFDQFASFLVSNTTTPCTLWRYWSVNDKCVWLSEIVKPPENINDRMEQRLRDRLEEMKTQMETIQSDLNKHILEGKAMNKTKLSELQKQLRWFMEAFDSNRNFTIQQAQEEVSSIVEQAACEIAWQHRLNQNEILANPQVNALAQAWINKSVAAIATSKESGGSE